MEEVIIQVVGQVMVYDKVNKHWNPAGQSSGLSTVRFLHCLPTNTFRIHGQKINELKEVVLDSQITHEVKFNKANDVFLQWSDSQAYWGLNFRKGTPDAENFFQSICHVLNALTTANQQQQQQLHQHPHTHPHQQQPQLNTQQQMSIPPNMLNNQHLQPQPQPHQPPPQTTMLHQQQQQQQPQIMNQQQQTQIINQQQQPQIMNQQQQPQIINQQLHQHYMQQQQQHHQQQQYQHQQQQQQQHQQQQQQQQQHQQQQQPPQMQQQQQPPQMQPQQAAPIPPPPPPPPPPPAPSAAPASNNRSNGTNNNVSNLSGLAAPNLGGDSNVNKNGGSPNQIGSLASDLANCKLKKVNLSRSDSDKESECNNNNIPNAKTVRAASLAHVPNGLMSDLNRKLASRRERIDQQGDGQSMSNSSGNNVNNTNGLGVDKAQYSWLAELIRKEITKAKAEIIDAIRAEMRQR